MTSREHWTQIFSNRSAEVLTAMMHANSTAPPDVLIHDDHDFAAALWGEHIGAYRVCFAITFRSPIETQRERWNDLWSTLRMRADLTPDPRMYAFWGDICIDTLPPSFQPNPLSSRRPQDFFMNPILPDVTHGFAEAGVRPPGTCQKVGITCGTVYSSSSRNLHKAEAALVKGGFSVTRLNSAGGSALPRSTYVDWLRNQDVVVCHGGRSTVLDCLALGIPMVCRPMGADQPYNSFRLASLGAGIDIGQESDIESAAVEAVRQICADELYYRNACRLSREIRAMPGADECATVILRGLEQNA